MTLYVGLDVLQKETEVCVIDGEGERVWRGKCPSQPKCIAAVLSQHAPNVARVGMETGPLAIWLWRGLRALGVPVDCIHARHVGCSAVVTDQQHGFERCSWHRSGRAIRAVSRGRGQKHRKLSD
jgi:hypothetical protein